MDKAMGMMKSFDERLRHPPQGGGCRVTVRQLSGVMEDGRLKPRNQSNKSLERPWSTVVAASGGLHKR